jgi:DNA-binding phage protein
METQEDIQRFLEECLSDDDPNTFIESLGFLIKKHGLALYSPQKTHSHKKLIC